jgi:hypothetical protein
MSVVWLIYARPDSIKHWGDLCYFALTYVVFAFVMFVSIKAIALKRPFYLDRTRKIRSYIGMTLLDLAMFFVYIGNPQMHTWQVLWMTIAFCGFCTLAMVIALTFPNYNKEISVAP